MTRLLMAALLLASFAAHGAATIDDVLTGYREVSAALAKDDFADAAMKAGKLVPLAEELSKSADPLSQCYGNLLKGAKAVSVATKEADVRKAMSLLSEPALWLVKQTPSIQSKWQLFKCPMVQGAFGYWMQPVGEPIANPYFGTSMLQCGVKETWAKFP